MSPGGPLRLSLIGTKFYNFAYPIKIKVLSEAPKEANLKITWSNHSI